MVMQVAVDARVLSHRPTGVARYLRGVLEAMVPQMAADERLELLSDGAIADPPGGLPVRILRWPLPGGDPAWRQLRLAAALARRPPDLLFCPFYTVPLLVGVPRVVTVHDVSFAAHPEWFRHRSRLAFSLVGPSARRARAVLTPSRFSAGEIERRLGVEREKIHVTPLGVDANWSAPIGEVERRALRKWLGVDGPYLLHLGAVHLRRHVDVSVDAFARLAALHPDLSLVVAGPDQPPAPDLVALARRRGVADRVLRRPWVPAEHLRALVAEARALIYLSDYEGFGLPALEAMACGTPVVALRRASLPEVLGEAAVWAESADPTEVAGAVAHLLEEDSLVDRVVDAGRHRARSLTWESCARRTLAVLRQLGPDRA